ncbi:MAG: VOC family protein [Acidimicrobiales bacterium]
MRVSAVHHVSINVDDLDRALGFYTGVLGLTVRTDRPALGVDGAWLDAGGQQVHLIVADVPPDRGQHLALLVDDLDAAVEELRALDVRVSDPVPVAGVRQAFFRDPAGNRVEIDQELGQQPDQDGRRP